MGDLAEVWVLDDDIDVVRSTSLLLRKLLSFPVREFTCAETLLKELQPGRVSCIVSDLVMPRIDGRQLQGMALAIDPTVNLVFLSGNAEISDAVTLMQHGAITFLEKPFRSDELVDAVKKGVEEREKVLALLADLDSFQQLLESLGEDEQEVMMAIVQGMSNKEIAFKLCISPRTLDRRRQRVLEVMQVASSIELAAKLERARSQLDRLPPAFSSRYVELARLISE